MNVLATVFGIVAVFASGVSLGIAIGTGGGR